MNARELQAENERLKKLLARQEKQREKSQRELSQSQRERDELRLALGQSQSQHEAVTAQYNQRLEEKQRRVAALEHQVKLLLQRIKGSRQERINPDQVFYPRPSNARLA